MYTINHSFRWHKCNLMFQKLRQLALHLLLRSIRSTIYRNAGMNCNPVSFCCCCCRNATYCNNDLWFCSEILDVCTSWDDVRDPNYGTFYMLFCPHKPWPMIMLPICDDSSEKSLMNMELLVQLSNTEPNER